MLDAAFLQDIVEHPDDDAPRLIYADWLADHGDEDRAELIRLQCRRAEMIVVDADYRSILGRETRLLEQHADRWRAALPKLPGVEWGDFSRGFVDGIRADSAEALLASAEAVYRAAPVRKLQIVGAFHAGWS